MTKISNQYSLTNILTADLANSRLGINNVSPAYSLDVTGTARVSGNVGFGGGTPSVFTGYSVASFGSLSTTTNGITIASTTTGNGLIEFADGVTGNQAYRGYLQYAHTADSLSFGTAGSDRMIITSAGNVGIGTSAPDTNLTVWGANVANNSASGNITVYTTTGYGANVGGSIGLGGYYNATTGYPLTFGNIYGKKENGTLDDSNGYLGFSTRNSSAGTVERMRITSGGQVLIGMSSAVSFRSDAQLQVNNCTILRSNDGYNGNPPAVIYSGNDTVGGIFIEFTSSSFTRIGSITRSGGSSIAYNTTSDIRLKKNINNALSSISKINSIQVRSFDWVADDVHQDFGFIAQELINVAPEAVTKGIKEQDVWQVDNSKLVPLLVKSIQELSAKVSLLENK